MRDYSPKSSPGMIEEFMKSIIYQDFQEELLVRIEDARDMLEVSESQLKDGVTHENVRGLVTCLRQMQGIFIDLMRNAREDMEHENEERNV